MDYKNTFQIYLTAIEDRINQYVPDIQPKNIYDPFKYVMAGGGKRIRPFLSMVCCGVVGANPFGTIAHEPIDVIFSFAEIESAIE